MKALLVGFGRRDGKQKLDDKGVPVKDATGNTIPAPVYTSLSLVKMKIDPEPGVFGYVVAQHDCTEQIQRDAERALKDGFAIVNVDLDAKTWGGATPGARVSVVDFSVVGYLGREFTVAKGQIVLKEASAGGGGNGSGANGSAAAGGRLQSV